ncbi:MAG: RAP domain-containing protein, partial [Planctomycetota bacterium]
AIAVEAQGRMSEFNAQNMANTVCAFATAGVSALTLFDAIAAEAQGRIREFNAQDMATMAWAFACAAWEQNEVFLELGSAIVEHIDALEDMDKSQLYLAMSYVRITWPDLDFPLSECLEDFRSAYTRRKAEASQLQRDVSVTLDQMGWNHVFEHVTEEGFSLGLARPESKLAIEVDGPSHSIVETTSHGRVLNGAMRFKSRLLRSFGWRIAHVPFYEWDGKSASERRGLLLEKLART